MLNIKFFTFNGFDENTYVIYNDKNECWIVDPGMYGRDETDAMIRFITDKQLLPQAIINTHTHIDHIFGVPAMIAKYNIPFGIHQGEMPVLQMAAGSATLFGFDFRNPPKPTFFIKEGEQLKLGEDTLDIRFVPGHSPGSIAFYYAPGKWVLSGDALFNESIGRTDLPGGNTETLLNSIRTQLFTLPDETIVLSGHGPETTIGHEKRYNMFLK